MKGQRPDQIEVPVAGNCQALSFCLCYRMCGITFSDEEVNLLTWRIRNDGTEVVEAKSGAGSATFTVG
ncbi:hypothetical protein [Sodalis sp.]|uniref:hypothetical protein n=1 Tax=Sodalis sp. (in: enterobacteria) TaxID=1898979 RepID=UPI0038739552